MKLKTMTELEILQCAYLFVESKIEDEMRVYRAANNSTKSLKVMGEYFERLKELKEAINAICNAPNKEELQSDEITNDVFDDIKSIVDNYLNNLYKAITKVVTLTYDISIPYDYRVPFQTAVSPVQYAFNMLENNLIELLEKYQGEDSNEDTTSCESCEKDDCSDCSKFDHCSACEYEDNCNDCPHWKTDGSKTLTKSTGITVSDIEECIESLMEGKLKKLERDIDNAIRLLNEATLPGKSREDTDIDPVKSALQSVRYNYIYTENELVELMDTIVGCE